MGNRRASDSVKSMQLQNWSLPSYQKICGVHWMDLYSKGSVPCARSSIASTTHGAFCNRLGRSVGGAGCVWTANGFRKATFFLFKFH